MCQCTELRNGNQLSGTVGGVYYGEAAHDIDPSGEYCRTCGSDACTCQECGKRICGTQSVWIEGKGNVGSSAKPKPKPTEREIMAHWRKGGR